MNGKDLLVGMNFIDSQFIEEAERQSPGVAPVRTAHRRIFLIAAMIALMLLLVGCAVVYVLKMENLKIGEATEEKYVFATDGMSIIGTETVNQNVLTLAGLEGSNPYKANAQWYAYREALLASISQMEQDGTLPEGYWENGTYQQDLLAKANELAQQYDLKPEGETLDFRTVRNMCDALGVERFQTTAEDVAVTVTDGGCYDNGSFWLNMDFSFQDGQEYDVSSTWGVLRWNRKDCFSRDYVLLEDTGDWKEWNYTTTSGNNVLILTSPSDWRGYILCDRGEALMSLQIEARVDLGFNVDGKTWFEYLYMTDRQMEQVADAIDFSIQPNLVTQEDAAAQPEAPSSATQNGYTLTLKSVETDGYVARILVSVTAPEGIDIESLDIGTGNGGNLTPTAGQAYGSGGFNDIPDDDGLVNTKDLLMEASLYFEDGSMPFSVGSTWNLQIEDLWVDKYRDTEQLLVEGEWSFPITFDETNGDYREIELLSEPITATACYGWGADGTDALEKFTVTSFKLRKFSSDITWDLIDDYRGEKNFGSSADFYSWRDHFTYAVMKDGSKIQMVADQNSEPIDLDQVDHVLLADGTRLEVPQ